MDRKQSISRRLAALACAAALTACGGGGGGGGTDMALAAPAPTSDGRNGDYAMYAGDAREYSLRLDFDARTYRVTGNGQDLAGAFVETGTAGRFRFDPASTLPSSPNAPRFDWFGDAVVGSFHLPSGTVPFIAARSFVTTLADAAGTYNYLVASRDSAAPADNFVFSGELLASGMLRTCNDAQVFRISLCPTVATAAVSVSGDTFTAFMPGGASYPFRIAKVGADRVFLRASASDGSSRRLQVGLPEAGFADGSFDGANNRGEGTFSSFSGASFAAIWNDGASSLNVTGSVALLGSDGPAGILGMSTATQGNFFAMRNGEIVVIMAARGNPVVPGYVEFGRK